MSVKVRIILTDGLTEFGRSDEVLDWLPRIGDMVETSSKGVITVEQVYFPQLSVPYVYGRVGAVGFPVLLHFNQDGTAKE